MCVYLHEFMFTMCLQYPQRPEEAIGSSRTGVTDSLSYLMWVLSTKPGSSARTVFQLLLVTVINQKRLEKEGVYFSSQATVHYLGKPRQELKQRSRKSSAYWLASPGCLRLLSYTTHVHSPRDGSAHSGLGLLTSTSN